MIETVLAGVAVFVGATVQSAIGFGFAIVAAPVVAATAGPETAAPTLALVGTLANVLLLAGERRSREVITREAVGLTAWSLPGMAAGAAVLAYASADVLSMLVAGAVLVAVAAHAFRARKLAGERRPPARWPSTAGAGALSGALATSTGLNGPPLVLHLLGRATPGQARDTLAAIFLVAGVLALGVFAVSGTLEVAPGLGWLALATGAGWAAGRQAFGRFQAHHEAASLAVLSLGAVVAFVLAAQALS